MSSSGQPELLYTPRFLDRAAPGLPILLALHPGYNEVVLAVEGSRVALADGESAPRAAVHAVAVRATVGEGVRP